MDKQTIRMEIITTLKKLPKQKRMSYNQQLISKLINSSEWKSSEVVGVTLARYPEIETEKIISAAWDAGKKVVIPYSGRNRRLSFYYYERDTPLEESKFGLLEPADRSEEVPKELIDLLIVPGLSYSKRGYRVGFGGGYYDRYLADYYGKTISILYPFQLDEQVEDLVEPFDIPIQKLFIASE